MDPTVATEVIEFGPTLSVILQGLAGVLLAVGTWAVKLLADKLGLEKDDKVRQYLNDAIKNGVEFGKKKAKEELSDADWTRIETKNVLLAHAAGYVLSKVPDAVKRFKLTEDDIKDLIYSRIDGDPNT